MPLSYFLVIYKLLELEMTTLGRQIDDLNLHSPSSLVFKKTERSKLHSLACQGFCVFTVMSVFSQDVFWQEHWRFGFGCFSDGWHIVAFGVCN